MNIAEVAKNIKIDLIPLDADGSHAVTLRAHLIRYGSYFYVYLWSKVFAQDLFSVFEKNGVMDTKTGIRYKKTILEKGSSEEEMDMLRNFLGREPNSNAFMKSLKGE